MVALTYPGVYIEELPSGQHVIRGVATSVAAFIGWSNQGPVGKAVMVESWTQYQSIFGGLLPVSGAYLGYAVYQFFQNGGTQAYVVRLVETSGAPPAIAVAANNNNIGGQKFLAVNPGAWGNQICVGISNASSTMTNIKGKTYNTFNLQVFLANQNKLSLLESYSLSGDPYSPQYAPSVLLNQSQYIKLDITVKPSPDQNTALIFTADWQALGGGAAAQTIGGVDFYAISAGAWGDNLSVQILNFVAPNFDLLITLNGLSAESFHNLSTKPTDPNYALNIVNSRSAFVRISSLPGPVADAGLTPLINGASGNGADGTPLTPVSGGGTPGDFESELKDPLNGYALLNKITFNLLCVPGETNGGVVQLLQKFCNDNRAFLIVDSDPGANIGAGTPDLTAGPADGGNVTYVTQYADHAALYFPWVLATDPLSNKPTLYPPCGYVAGIYASVDASRGVWKSPAGVETGLTGALGLQYPLTDTDSGLLNPVAVNCLRQFPAFGTVVWGARTIAGSDAGGSQWQYVPIRRFALFLESSLYEGTQWAVFEPNAEPTWSQVRMSIGAFMQDLFLQGAFAGTSPQTSYFVKCDADNNPPSNVAMGVLTVTVGFAPLYPAEFIVIQIQQMTQS
jgi:phage tail sheath protein FI